MIKCGKPIIHLKLVRERKCYFKEIGSYNLQIKSSEQMKKKSLKDDLA